MLNKFLKVLLLLLTLVPGVEAQSRKFGLGGLLGDPTALSGKYFMSKTGAVDAGLSFGDHHFLIYSDYLQHWPGTFKVQNDFISSLSPYLGVGPILAWNTGNNNRKKHHIFADDSDDFALGVRIPFGIEWIAPEIPLGVSLEVVPGMVVLEETDGFMQGAWPYATTFSSQCQPGTNCSFFPS